eukprot:366462-Chlamydomonas_euryale.AAC.47
MCANLLTLSACCAVWKQPSSTPPALHPSTSRPFFPRLPSTTTASTSPRLGARRYAYPDSAWGTTSSLLLSQEALGVDARWTCAWKSVFFKVWGSPAVPWGACLDEQ